MYHGDLVLFIVEYPDLDLNLKSRIFAFFSALSMGWGGGGGCILKDVDFFFAAVYLFVYYCYYITIYYIV